MNDIDGRLWYVIGGLLVLGVVGGLIWYVRQISLKRAAVPSAFLIALAIHAALGAGLFYVGLGEHIIEAVHKAQAVLPSLESYAASTRYEAQEGYRPAPQPFELVKELGAKDSVATAEVPQLPLATPEMRISAGGVKVELPVPREETPGKRAEEMAPAPSTPEATAPARSGVRDVETPEVPEAPLENVASLPAQVPVEQRAPAEPVEIARAPAVVDPLAKAGPVKGSIPADSGAGVLPGDLRDDRASLPVDPVRPTQVGSPLTRASRPAFDDAPIAADPLRTGSSEPGAAGSGKPGKSAVAVDVARQGTQLPGVNLGPPSAGGSGSASTPGGLSTGDLAKSANLSGGLASSVPNAVPTFGPGSLPQRRGVDVGLASADSSIGPEALLKARQSDNSLEAIEKHGGTKASQEAVVRGLSWLEQHQFPDGRWSLHEFSQRCAGHKPCTAQGNLPCDTAATAFALLPFLGNGHTQHEGKHPIAVQRGLDWLVQKQRKSGELTTGNEGKARMYGHGVAAIALCEAYAMSQDPRLREPAQRSLDFIVASQHKASGGWRYQPNEHADTSVVGWQIMALKSGQMARLNVPQQPFDLARKWLDSVEGQGSQRGHFGYQDRNPTPAMTAEGLLCRQYLGATRDDAGLVSGANYLLANLPDKRQENGYYWYYGTQTMYHLQGDYWKKWNAALRDMLVETQIKEGPMAGTWAPVDRGEVTGGRVYATALRVLMLEVYYRYLPLYQSLEE